MPAAIKTTMVETRNAVCIRMTTPFIGADPNVSLLPTNRSILISLGRLLAATAKATARAKLVGAIDESVGR